MVERWLARGPRTIRGFVGKRRVRGRLSVDGCHEKTGSSPKDETIFDNLSCTVESKEYGGRWPSDRERKPVLLPEICGSYWLWGQFRAESGEWIWSVEFMQVVRVRDGD